MAGSLRAFLDASVLYPVSLRNLFMRLTVERLFQARWSADVHEEWIRAVLRDHPHIPPARLHTLRDAMDRHAQDAVVAGYEGLVDSLKLPDPNDRHILAAAITCHADVIVTHNLRDFPDAALAPYSIEARHPDDFVRQLLDQAPAAVVKAVRSQQASLRNPPVSMAELLALFERLDLAVTATELRRLLML